MCQKKTAIVTGGSGGIGSAICVALARAGFDVAVHYMSGQDRARSVADAVAAQGRRCVCLQADVADPDSVASMVEDARICLGEPDVLVCNAGIARQQLFSDITFEQWNRVISVNLGGVFNCCKAVIPSMLARSGGSIINISSIWGLQGAALETHYSASKAGVIGLTQALARELAPSGIRVNCVAPGAIDTPMNAHLDSDAVADIIDRTPLGALGTPQQVADAVVFLAGEQSSFITGTTLPVTGGFM